MSWKYLNKNKISDTAPFAILRKPVISEKATLISQFSHYVFIVDSRATKPEIKQAIESLYKVKVLGVNTLPRRGKIKKFKGKPGYVSGMRKAIIRLEAGQLIDIGAAVA